MKPELMIRIGIGFGGAALGGLISWIAVKEYYNKKAEKEIAEARVFYSNVRIKDYVKEPSEEEKASNSEKPRETPSEHQKSTRNAPVIDYTKFYRKPHTDDPAESESPPEGELDAEEMAELNRYLDGHKMTTDADDVGIQIISEKSFKEDFLQFDKSTLFYYTVDEVLTTEEDEVIDNEEVVVGSTLDDSGIRYGDVETTLYIRNFDLGADYEIQKIIGSFR